MSQLKNSLGYTQTQVQLEIAVYPRSRRRKISSDQRSDLNFQPVQGDSVMHQQASVSAIQFSIVITTYNRLELLKRAIQSALEQTVPCEVVVADDCSTDDTAEYVKSWSQDLRQQGDFRLVYHCNPKNSGHAETMNQGVAVASGNWIKPVDDDDYLAPDCIEQMVQAIAIHHSQVAISSHSEAVICSCQAAQVDPNGQELSRTRIIGPGKAFYIPQEEIHYGMLLEQVPFGTPIQVAYSKAAFIKSGGWDSNFDANCDDIDSWIKMAQYGDAIFVNQCLAYRTIWPGAYNQQFSLERRLSTNIVMKEKIYSLVHPKYQSHLPELDKIRDYLKLHWGLVALKKAKIKSAFELSSSAILSPKSWSILLSSIAARQRQNFPNLISNFHSSFSQKNYPDSTHSFAQEEPNIVPDSQLLNNLAQLKFRYSLAALKQGKIRSSLQLGWSGIQVVFHPNQMATQEFTSKTLMKANPQDQIQVVEQMIDALKKDKDSSYTQELRTYIKLRSSISSFKQGQVIESFRLAFPCLSSVRGWKMLISMLLFEEVIDDQVLIQKNILIE